MASTLILFDSLHRTTSGLSDKVWLFTEELKSDLLFECNRDDVCH